MSVDTEPRPADIEPAPEPVVYYRALSSAAVASLMIGCFSAAALLNPVMVAIPVIGIVLSIYALRNCTRRSDELSGRNLAIAGLGLSSFFAVAGPARQYHEYVNECLPGYNRISYSDLQPDPDVPSQLIPPDVFKLEGKKVFIKGYPFPGEQKSGIKQFILCRDQGDCCFGGDPKLTDRIHVRLTGSLQMEYKLRLLKLHGIFHVREPQPGEDLPSPYYFLEADRLQ